ncbi:MAG: bifunctional UDP-N-acetylglucosamine diphosphorylase/glucosamine-1-phosphate N-acetyltransferase GlmU [Anaerolineae bacterium]|nr:bifunctional UDP-N-acetylglucosamine diphosphorylase/glucosamine-1-phosphate N-acetyltransferase GlmU [Anaerolineae bacterium]
MENVKIIILAAGLGKRMKSKHPKVLHPLCGKPMLEYVLEIATALTPQKPVVVIGHGGEEVAKVVGERAITVHQGELLGTGHAVLKALETLTSWPPAILVLYGDMPLLRKETLEEVIRAHWEQKPTITFLTVHLSESMGFGRVVRDESGNVVKVVEEAEANPQEKAITELNVGVYCFQTEWLKEHLPSLKPHPNGEYYLPDLIGVAIGEGNPVQTVTLKDPEEAMGINNRYHLALAEAAMRRRINRYWMESGVTFINPEVTYVEAGVEIGRDTIIYPHTFLLGKTKIGEDCVIGPGTIIKDSRIGDKCVVEASVVEGAVLEEEVKVGPFSHLRPGTHLARGVHIGNFAEIKNSYIGPGTKVNHFSYLGDATVGAKVNIGAGTITCNFDGQTKHPTIIEDEAFIGSDTMLVAPVKVGKKAKTGAGSVVTRDVPPGALVYGVPAKEKK